MPPKLTHQADPHFTKDARKHNISGNVEVALCVDENGLPQDVRVVRGVGYGLDEEALKAVRKYRFKPATQRGVPVKVKLYVDVSFQLF